MSQLADKIRLDLLVGLLVDALVYKKQSGVLGLGKLKIDQRVHLRASILLSLVQ
jgi:hypothetical protein